MKKVFVQVPCLNEAETIESVIKGIPKKIDGVDLQILIIDDGCTDDTVKIARALGVKHFVIHKKWMGLARAFQNGVNYSLEHGADIVVNTDGDNQYPQASIPDLIQPILDGEADIVIGDRQTQEIAHFSPFKKLMQRFGSAVVNKAAGTKLPDAASGFRAYSRDALYRLTVVTKFSYCMETIIQAGNKRIPITSIPIKTNAKTRESRLFKNIWQHMFQSMGAIVRSYLMYKPYALFTSLSVLLGIAGLIPFIRYLVLIVVDERGNHLQSLLLGAVLLTGSFLAIALGVIADLIRINRTLIEEQLEISRRSYTQPKN
jgi:glycosyltransferase involved in cell wall biosynthesis